jgi:hypothetical protein
MMVVEKQDNAMDFTWVMENILWKFSIQPEFNVSSQEGYEICLGVGDIYQKN